MSIRPAPDYEAIFRSAPDLYLLLGPDLMILAVSDAYALATMTQPQTVIGRGLFEVFPDNPDDPAATGVGNLRTSLERVLRTKTADAMAVQKYDIRKPESEGGGFEERFWSPVNTPILSADGELLHIIHRVEDVTEFMRLKQERAQKDAQAQDLLSRNEKIEAEIILRAREVQEANRKLEAANAELGKLCQETHDLAESQQRFFSHVSHELRTPLTLILGPVENLLAARSDLADEQIRDLEVIARNARTLLRHVNDLLDVVKYQSGSMQLAYSRADLAERLRVAVAHFDSASTGRTISVSVVAPPHLEADVDVEQIDRILINLLSNAFKFAPVDGRIRCTLSADRSTATLTVADNGPGVPADLREAIFEPFRQGDEGLTRRASGTGLGLAIVRDFVTLHGGTITVRDAEGGGAFFECRLPLRAPAGVEVKAGARVELEDWNFRQAVEAHRHRVPATAPASAAAPLVLVVEDNQDMSQFIAQTLGRSYRIAIARDGVEGLGEARRLKPDLIVSDLMMPVMSGDQLIEALAERPDLCDIPVLLLTARADEETRIEALRQGVQDFLAKPFSVNELRARVENLIRAKQAADLVKRGRRISEEKYRQLMDGARDAIFILTADDVILDANHRAEEFCGALGSSVIGVRLDEALSVRRTDGAPFSVDTSTILQLESCEVGEESRRFEASGAAVTIEAEQYRLMIVRDVTEQRRLENQFRRVQKLDALGQLTGGIAHDFNNLLTAVAANAEVLKTRLAERPDLAALAVSIERATDRGSAMTRRLLAFARRQPVVLREFDTNQVVAASVEMLTRMLPSNVAIECKLDPELWPAVIDPSQLEDALVNLVINARDAMPVGGRVVIETARRSLRKDVTEAGALAAGDYASIVVADTGAGMDAQTLQRVFEPFFTTKEEGKGTGLGLSMVYGFARQSGGDVRIESKLGQGTSVTILLPRAAVSAVGSAHGARSASD